MDFLGFVGKLSTEKVTPCFFCEHCNGSIACVLLSIILHIL